MEQVHLLIKNAKVFNSYLKKFISANVAVKEGKFYYIDRKQDTDFQADNVIDAKGSYMIPGLTDIHPMPCLHRPTPCKPQRYTAMA